MLSLTACPDYSGKSRLAGKTLIQTLFFFLLITQICFAQWVQVGLDSKSIKDIAVRNSNIFGVTADSGSLWRSTDGGTNWTLIIGSGAVDVATAPTTETLFMVKDDSLFSSSDDGNNWVNNDFLQQLPPHSGTAWPINVSVSPSGLVFCGMNRWVHIGAWQNAFALSTDDGLSWTTPGWDTLGGILFDFRDQSTITVGYYSSSGGAGGSAIYLSFDNGQLWMQAYYPPDWNSTTLNLCLNGNILWGGGWINEGGGLYISTDTCSSWTRVNSIIPECGLSLPAGGMLAGTDSLGVFLFNDDGDSLGSRNDGLTNLNIHSLTIDNNDFVYAGTDNGVWRRPLSEITSVEEEQIDEIPTEFLLSQNFPNPFNPSTKIKYSIPQSSNVVIKVFDVLGNEIETLVNEEKPAGTYELSWYAEGLPSGVYFYQLRAGEYTAVKKMLLLK